jgi:hypothetical protein
MRLSTHPDEETTRRRDDWLKVHDGWQIEHVFGIPGWWVATFNGRQAARYNFLDDLLDRLEDVPCTGGTE